MRYGRQSRFWGAFLLAFAAACGGDDGGDAVSGGEGSTSAASTTSAGATSGPSATSDSSTTDSGPSSSSTTDDPGTSGGTTGGDGSSGAEGTSSGQGTGSTGDGTGGSTGGGVVSDDPFDPASCGGAALTEPEASQLLGAMPRLILDDATIQVRTRMCPAGVCGDWGTPENWVISYLTWSGGVVTAYKDFQADMQLVAFDDQGTARVSMQHVTFPTGGYPDTDGMVYDLPPSVIDFAHVRAYDDDPDFEYYYQDLDWLVRNGTLVLGEDCARWTADPYVQQPPYTEQYAAVFRW